MLDPTVYVTALAVALAIALGGMGLLAARL